MQMDIRVDDREVRRRLERLQNGLPAALARAANRAIDSAATDLGRSVAQDMQLKVGDVRARLSATYASADHPVATLKANTRRVSAFTFAARELRARGRGRRGAGVTAKLPGAPFAHAFIRMTGRGVPAVFERVGKARHPIRQLHGPSVWLVAQKHVEKAWARPTEVFATRVQHEVGRLLGR